MINNNLKQISRTLGRGGVLRAVSFEKKRAFIENN
jgi:hypothetical protein